MVNGFSPLDKSHNTFWPELFPDTLSNRVGRSELRAIILVDSSVGMRQSLRGLVLNILPGWVTRWVDTIWQDSVVGSLYAAFVHVGARLKTQQYWHEHIYRPICFEDLTLEATHSVHT